MHRLARGEYEAKVADHLYGVRREVRSVQGKRPGRTRTVYRWVLVDKTQNKILEESWTKKGLVEYIKSNAA